MNGETSMENTCIVKGGAGRDACLLSVLEAVLKRGGNDPVVATASPVTWIRDDSDVAGPQDRSAFAGAGAGGFVARVER